MKVSVYSITDNYQIRLLSEASKFGFSYSPVVLYHKQPSKRSTASPASIKYIHRDKTNRNLFSSDLIRTYMQSLNFSLRGGTSQPRIASLDPAASDARDGSFGVHVCASHAIWGTRSSSVLSWLGEGRIESKAHARPPVVRNVFARG